MRILIVEDETIFRMTLQRYLSNEEFEARGVRRGQEAWSMLRTEAIEMLLLDLGLPDCDGLDLLADVSRVYPHLPVVVITALDAPGVESRAFQLGARAFFRKPVVLYMLKDTLRAIADTLGRG